MRVMISGAPATGKGTQCSRIVEKVFDRLAIKAAAAIIVACELAFKSAEPAMISPCLPFYGSQADKTAKPCVSTYVCLSNYIKFSCSTGNIATSAMTGSAS